MKMRNSTYTGNNFLCQPRKPQKLVLSHSLINRKASMIKCNITSVFELAKAGPMQNNFGKIFEVYSEHASCRATTELSNKYGIKIQNEQHIVAITNKITFEQTWFNEERRNKPQTFKEIRDIRDPTTSGQCDFCEWETLSAEDNFGRVINQNVTSASNLFKYCAPSHGLLIFKKHTPYTYTQDQIIDLMSATSDWLSRAYEADPDAEYPLFLWNCLARAGASQFHAHAQVMLSKVSFPCYDKFKSASLMYQSLYNASYLKELILAYEEVDLVRSLGTGYNKCLFYPSITPWKDMEILIWTKSIRNSTFCYVFYQILKTLRKEFGMSTFNISIQGIPKDDGDGSQSQNWWNSNLGLPMARIVSRGKANNPASDFGGLEVLGGSSIGLTDPFQLLRVIEKNIPQLTKSTSLITEDLF